MSIKMADCMEALKDHFHVCDSVTLELLHSLIEVELRERDLKDKDEEISTDNSD